MSDVENKKKAANAAAAKLVRTAGNSVASHTIHVVVLMVMGVAFFWTSVIDPEAEVRAATETGEVPWSVLLAALMSIVGLVATLQIFKTLQKQIGSTTEGLAAKIEKEGLFVKGEETSTFSGEHNSAEAAVRETELQLFYAGLDTDDKTKLYPLFLARERLIAEESRLGRRASGNLMVALGLSFSLIFVLVILIFLNFLNPFELTFTEFILRYSPFLTLFVLVEVLAFFFLRMFAWTEAERTKNKNEITNIELRMTAFILSKTDGVDPRELTLALAIEERNFILKKNETSSMSQAIPALTKLLELVKSG